MVVLRQNDDAHGDHPTTNINTERTRLGSAFVISKASFQPPIAISSLQSPVPFSFSSATLAIHDVISMGGDMSGGKGEGRGCSIIISIRRAAKS
jgi:hypothetical protein